MKRLMLDTCIVVDMLINANTLDKHIVSLLEDYSYTFYASFETLRELVVLFNNHKIHAKKWKTSEDVLNTVVNDMGITILPLREEVAFTYSRLQINEIQDHRDPSDHIIVAHAITEHIPLISSDLKLPFYRGQGLDLIQA